MCWREVTPDANCVTRSYACTIACRSISPGKECEKHANRWVGLMSGSNGCGKLRKRETPSAERFRQQAVQRPTKEFEEALDDDLNISAALGFLFESIRETNRAMDHN